MLITSHAQYRGYVAASANVARLEAARHQMRRLAHLPNGLPKPPSWKVALAAKALQPEPDNQYLN